MYAEGAKIYGKNESSIHEIAKREKEIWVSFANPKATANVWFALRERLHSQTFYYYIMQQLFYFIIIVVNLIVPDL